MTYCDGFILPMRDDRVGDYKPMAESFAKKAMAVGALGSFESIGDNLEHGKVTDFYRSVNAQEGENVVFSFILWPDKETRDKGWEVLMADPDLQPGKQEMPFDGMRMFWGGFTPIVDTFERSQ